MLKASLIFKGQTRYLTNIFMPIWNLAEAENSVAYKFVPMPGVQSGLIMLCILQAWLNLLTKKLLVLKRVFFNITRLFIFFFLPQSILSLLFKYLSIVLIECAPRATGSYRTIGFIFRKRLRKENCSYTPQRSLELENDDTLFKRRTTKRCLTKRFIFNMGDQCRTYFYKLFLHTI